MTSRDVRGWKSGSSSSRLPSKKRLLNPGPRPARACWDIWRIHGKGIIEHYLTSNRGELLSFMAAADLLQHHVVQIELLQWPGQGLEGIRTYPADRIPRQPQVSEVSQFAQGVRGHLFQFVCSQVECVEVSGPIQCPGGHVTDGVSCEVERSEALRTRQRVGFQPGDGVVLQVKSQQTGHQLEGLFGECGKAIFLQVKVCQCREACGEERTFLWGFCSKS